MVQQRIDEDVVEFKYVFEPVNKEIFSSFISISSVDTKQINVYLAKHKNNLKGVTPARVKTSRDSIGFGKSTQILPKESSPLKQS